MNHRELAVPRDAAKGWGSLDHVRPAKQEDVLPVPPRDVVVLPDRWTHEVHRQQAVRLEALGPVVRPLLVEVVVAALVRNGGGEQDRGAEPCQRFDENIGGVGG